MLSNGMLESTYGALSHSCGAGWIGDVEDVLSEVQVGIFGELRISHSECKVRDLQSRTDKSKIGNREESTIRVDDIKWVDFLLKIVPGFLDI